MQLLLDFQSALVWLADQLGVPAYAPVYSKFEAASALNDAIKVCSLIEKFEHINALNKSFLYSICSITRLITFPWINGNRDSKN
jgi:hypothetical protein